MNVRFLFSSFLFLFVIFIGQAENFHLNESVYSKSMQMNKVFLKDLIVPSLVQTNSKLESPLVSAHNAVLLDQSSSRILFEKNAHEKTSIASLTKVMTAIVAIEYGELDDKVETSARAIHTSGSSIYLQKDEKMTLEDLLYGLMLRSGNDAAVAIAEHIGGSVEGFVYLMNEKAAYLGLSNTHFANPHGLEDEEHYSTAYDVAKIMQYAMNNEEFKKITSSKSYHSKNRTYQWNNKNKLLKIYEEFCIGGKTGFTKRAGRTLVTSSEKENFQVIAVTLNAPDDWNDHMSLYNWGFKHYEPFKLVSKGTKKFKVANDEEIEGIIQEDIVFPLQENEIEGINEQIILNDDQNNLEGKLSFSINENVLATVNFELVKKEDKSFYEQFLSYLKKLVQVNDDD